jgi:hypothetical protein
MLYVIDNGKNFEVLNEVIFEEKEKAKTRGHTYS